MSGYVANNRNVRPTPEIEPYSGDFDKQPKRSLVLRQESQNQLARPEPVGCVFAKSCNLPPGEINYSGFVTPEPLSNYGTWAVLGTAGALTTSGTALHLAGSSTSGTAIASRLGGSLSLGLLEGVGATAASTAAGLLLLLIPDSNEGAHDSAFYSNEQFHLLTLGRIRAKAHVQQLPEGHLNAYGYYTGGKPDWEMVKVVAATARGEQFAANLGQGIELIWTPAADPNELGIPALEGAPEMPSVWIYPPTKQADQALVNPTHPPEYNDSIVWFPGTAIQPIYISLSVPSNLGYYPPPKDLAAFPDAKPAPRKTPIRGGGGLRKRWKTRDGTIYEWDSQHGAVEKYDKRGKHLGEFDATTGEQNKGPDKTRGVEP